MGHAAEQHVGREGFLVTGNLVVWVTADAVTTQLWDRVIGRHPLDCHRHRVLVPEIFRVAQRVRDGDTHVYSEPLGLWVRTRGERHVADGS